MEKIKSRLTFSGLEECTTLDEILGPDEIRSILGGDAGEYGSYSSTEDLINALWNATPDGGFGIYSNMGDGTWSSTTYDPNDNSVPNGYCTMGAMAQIGSLCNASNDPNTYIAGYANMIGQSTVAANLCILADTCAPDQTQTQNLLNLYYNTTAISTTGQLISAVTNGDPVFAVIDYGNGNGHAVVFEGYNSADGTMTYYDPSTGSTNTTDPNNPINVVGMYKINSPK